MKEKTIDGNVGEQINWFNRYLASGHGRGRLISAATVHDGKVGYFCVHPIEVEGVKQECILFACMPHEDIVITTDFPQPFSGEAAGCR